MKMKKFTVSLFASVLLFQFVFAQAQDKDIKQQSQQLSDVRKNIKKKQLEKDRLILQEKVFRRELNSLNDAIDKAGKKLEKLSQDIKSAEKNLASASSQYDKLYEKKTNLNDIMLDEIDFYNKMTFTLAYEDDPVEYKIRQAALKYKKENYDKEAKEIDFTSAEIKKWETAKKKLMALKAEEDATAKERIKLIKEKNELLKSTKNKRAAAEEEIKILNESAKELQTLINKLAEIQKRKQSAEAPSAAAAPSPAVRGKKLLPWPVEGKVVLKFGKNKHPELDAYVISNGIKIKTDDFAQVKSIATGTVVFTGNFRSYGKVIIIDHNKDSYFTVYGQLDQILVKEDQKVYKGTVVAKLGKGDDSILYFEIRRNNTPDNPLLWLIKK
ncbi:MAG: peptidoglycan DD-metalloendopeptidase family protein [Endomicrobium sp.]|jgi:septal ring factor EnvC (AmiA/AmiB activator)|nr:peptidoglycan DD-metalloendopeptidase family protein [Endomicrobium sp.]